MTGERARTLRVAVIGAGIAGILSAIRLRQAGVTEVTVYEKADRVGGTWRENTYPGLACDVPSHLYSYSFELNPEWSHVFSPGPEIQDYLQGVAARHRVEECVRFGAEVVACTFAGGRWTVETAAGERDEVDVVIAATGVLHHPRLPDLPGLASFAGAAFHSARWDHRVALDGARIGVIGTGSTAMQITGALASRAARFSLFQRTAQWVHPQVNPPYSEEERAGLRAHPEQMRTVHEQLSALFSGFSNSVVDQASPGMKMIEDACRANLEDNVADPELRARLRPDYRAGCKRLVLSTNFYDAIQEPTAELVTDGIAGVEEKGVRTTDGRLHELDVLVLATGFHVNAFMRPMTIVGRDGATLDAVWAARPAAYLSVSMPDFPNFFMLNGPNGPVGNFSLIEVAELQLAYIMQLIERLDDDGRRRQICATREALQAFEAERVEATSRTIWATGCRSWYLDDRGVPSVWPWSFDRYREVMTTPTFDAFEVR